MSARPSLGAGKSVAIIGAGWSGLAAALELTQAGQRVSLYEAAPLAGGRARRADIRGLALDNGSHLMLGAYTATLKLLARVGGDRHLERRPLVLDQPPHFRLALPRLPAPLHLAWGLMAARGLGIRDKLAAATFMAHLQRQAYRLEQDMPVTQLLDQQHQPPHLQTSFWQPLCLAALNTPAEQASAQVFAQVLQDSLGGGRAATDLVLATRHLGALLPDPALDWLRQRGQEIRLGCRIQAIHPVAEGWQLQLPEGQSRRHDRVILAVAPQHAAPLLPQAAPTASSTTSSAQTRLLASLQGLTYQPIATCYLAYPPDIVLPWPLLALAGPLGQWVFDRGLTGTPGLLACVLSAHGPWEACDASALATVLHGEIQTALGRPLPPPHWHQLVREARATFSCTPGLERPGTATPWPGFFLAGDYVDNGYPATLEGAVRNGLAAARAALG